VLVHSSWGGQGIADYLAQPGTIQFVDPASIVGQVWIQLKAVLITIAWTGIVSAVLFFALDKIFGLRPATEAEREGLDVTEHGERAYNY
jgi:Amt family ammonium transporter